VTFEDYMRNQTLRWAVERALTLAAEIVVDILSHILTSKFAIYPETHEEAIEKGWEKGLISEGLYHRLEGLGRFHNLLVHLYMKIDDRLVYQHWQKSPPVLRDFLTEISDWLENQL